MYGGLFVRVYGGRCVCVHGGRCVCVHGGRCVYVYGGSNLGHHVCDEGVRVLYFQPSLVGHRLGNKGKGKG